MILNESATSFLTRVSADVIFGTIVLAAVLGSLSDPYPSNLTVILTTVLKCIFLVINMLLVARISNMTSYDLQNQLLAKTLDHDLAMFAKRGTSPALISELLPLPDGP